MNSGNCLNLAVVPDIIKETNDNSPDKSNLSDDIIYQLIPTINAVHMIAELIESEALGKIKLGPYKQYISDLKECAEIQHEFSRKLIKHLDSV